MKKVIFSSAFALALTLGAGYTYNATDGCLSELQLLNAEALAEAETKPDPCPETSGDGCYDGRWWPNYREGHW